MQKQGRKPRSQAQIGEVRSKIIGHALTLFQEEGYDSVSIRRLAKEAGCAPMTIYAHFDGKINILQHLWAVVLDSVFSQIRSQVEQAKTPHEKLSIASQIFVDYWLTNPDHFRLVFMSSGITRPDVDSFLKNDATLSHFKYFSGLVMLALGQTHTPNNNQVKTKTDALISSLIGIVLCANTIADYPWTSPRNLVQTLITGLIRADDSA